MRECEACGYHEMTRKWIDWGRGLTKFWEYQCPECDYKFQQVAG